jgi:uncharacterized protein
MPYSAPGIYVEEVPSAIKPIAGVSTSTAGFIGVVPDTIQQIAKDPAGTPENPTKWVDFTVPTPVNTAKLITNWTQFTVAFGDLVGTAPEPPSPAAAVAPAGGATGAGATGAGGSPAPARSTGHDSLAHAVYGFFNNGGSRCFVVRITAEAGLDAALTAFAPIDEIAVVAAPGLVSPAAREKIVTHCKAADRFAILDGPETATNLTTLTAASGVMPQRTDYAAWYFPWIKVFDPATKLEHPTGDGSVGVPPSGHLAGVYARVDEERGVHKAPANEAILGALDVTQAISKADQMDLNPAGVNCIRVLNANVLVWGARTVGGDANADLKYVNVRRTLLFLRKSIEQGTQWVVFEPNSPALWQRITRNVTAFLTTVWRSGALFGTTAAQAFYVKCDAETNPPELRDLGQVVTEIGVAIVRPAEFVIFRISQFTAPGP